MDFLFSDLVDADASLVGEENGVLTLNHCSGDAEENDTDERGESAAFTARRRAH